MKKIKLLLNSVIKNFKKMFDSKSTLITLFLGPFILLFLIQGAYQNTDTIYLDVGIIKEINTSLSEEFILMLYDSGFNVINYDHEEKCKSKIREKEIDICIKISNKTKPTIDLTVDYSEINLATTMVSILNEKILKQSSDLRVIFIDKLSEKIKESNSLISDMKQKYEKTFNNINETSKDLETIKTNLENNTKEFEEAKKSLNHIKSLTNELYWETSESLSESEDKIEDARSDLIEQKNIVNELKNKNEKCEDEFFYSINQTELLNSNPDEIIEIGEEYGKCKCVEFYINNLEEIEKDIDEMISYTNSIIRDIHESKKGNKEFYEETEYQIKFQKENIDDFSKEITQTSKNISNFTIKLNNNLANFELTLTNIENSSNNLNNDFELSAKNITNPINIIINPINSEKKIIVYLFPKMFIFIIMLITLIFSSTFVFSEKKSQANYRNKLSPLNKIIENTGYYISIITLITIQSIAIIILAKIAFGLNITSLSIIRILLISTLATTIFTTIGISLGYIFKTELMTIFISLGINVILFLYSNIIRPVEMMPQLVKTIVNLNPYVISTQAISKIILFNTNITSLLKEIKILSLEIFIVIIILTIITKLRNKE